MTRPNEIRQKAIVKPGGVIEICSPELPSGTTVEVIILMELTSDESERFLTSFIGAAKGSFATPEAADQFIRQERDSWES